MADNTPLGFCKDHVGDLQDFYIDIETLKSLEKDHFPLHIKELRNGKVKVYQNVLECYNPKDIQVINDETHPEAIVTRKTARAMPQESKGMPKKRESK